MAEPRAEPGTVALAGDGVEVTRGGRPVIGGLSFRANRGRVHAILGPNGAGKSTLLRALAGLLPHAGSITLDGEEVSSLDIRTRARRISFVPQRSQLAANLPVEAVVAQGRFAHGSGFGRVPSRDNERVAQAMARGGVEPLRGRPFTQLSYGEQRRVLLARALATGASTLLLDEPTASLDIAHALELHNQLRELADGGKCVVIVLHALQDALRFVDDATLLSDGRLVADGPVAEVLKPEHIERIYGVTPRPGEGIAFELKEPDGP